MALTEPTARKSTGGKEPRKRFVTIARKRKAPRNTSARIAVARKSSPVSPTTKKDVETLDPRNPAYFYHLRQALKSGSNKAEEVLKQLDDGGVSENKNLHTALFKDLAVTLTLLADVMEYHEHEKEIQRLACSILNKLLDEEAFDLSKLQIIGIGDVMRALLAFPDEMDVVHEACQVLVTVCESDATLHTFDHYSHGEIQTVIGLLQDHEEKLEIQIAGCHFLTRMAKYSEESRILVLEANFHPILFKACKLHGTKDASFQKLLNDVDWSTAPEQDA